ncbi:mitochondrial 50S ribosomal protein L11, putative [Pediculus humanus corporis]|uniref:Large ribosomal subunit protein uL11m n=1 Tax=Pediculus humanus subsp. corporis TaxID=121224 RepID=E0W267_PEDHC|nr:mitochondrial 50S ribosomal protein L11, putative [Pediculus humanus corporis]EEB19723.1 mitochondrial 50S ribosomal protein L11, putative [Pediculus humanus corporis]
MSKVAKVKAALSATGSRVIQANLFRTVIAAQSASAGPPLGPILGKFGLNISAFCKNFNEQTKTIKQGIPLPVTVRIKPDKSFIIEIHTPPIKYYLFQAAGINRGKVEGDTTPSGKISLKHAYEIAKIKHNDPYEKFQLFDLEQVVRRVLLVARQNGIEITRDLDPNEYQTFLKERFAYLEELDKQIEAEKMAKFAKA